jgi:outer membrane murein-binding lipoprotein Lpp
MTTTTRQTIDQILNARDAARAQAQAAQRRARARAVRSLTRAGLIARA